MGDECRCVDRVKASVCTMQCKKQNGLRITSETWHQSSRLILLVANDVPVNNDTSTVTSSVLRFGSITQFF